ncbi:LysM repeat-containing protein [Desulfocurvibacter africanus PCS]|uniref:LysM repeat-containing protein n=1 Tax=Desulfocurvibacter africanus PCS TaxID=1262666 RepID=M5PV47_DESAF|nr:lytic transglycosylase domain-containing protein [Desulfocurvibacter africanus]EMG38212.1 LysM repeat-containing protein [Desulfocurvibacter africanus PCS]
MRIASAVMISLVLLATACATRETGPTTSSSGAQLPPSPFLEANQCALDEEKKLAGEPEAQDLDPELSAEPSDLSGELTAEEREALKNEPEIQFQLTVTENEAFAKYFHFFTAKDKDGNPGKGRKAFELWLERSQQFLPYVRQVFRERGLPEDLVFLPFAESGYNAWAYSRAGAAGMWQFMPFTGRKFGLTVDWWSDERRDPYKATHAAADYLTVLHNMFGDWYLALAAYNAGEGRISRALRKSGTDNFFDLAKDRRLLALETRDYVPKFLAIIKIVKNLESLGFKPLNWNEAPQLETVEVQGGTDLLAMSTSCEIDWKEFQKLNPSFRRHVSNPEQKCTVYLPAEKLTAVNDYLSKPNARPYAGWLSYRVRSGDSWWALSRRFDTPIAVLKKLNNMSSNTLRPGAHLMIPGKGGAKYAAAKYSEPTPARAKTQAIAQKRANYVVQTGDTLWDIAQRHNVSLNTLRKANGLSSGKNLSVGQRLYIPDTGGVKQRIEDQSDGNRLVTHKVRRGDTLWDIARRYNVSPQRLMTWNNLNKRSVIRPGDKLKVYVE